MIVADQLWDQLLELKNQILSHDGWVDLSYSREEGFIFLENNSLLDKSRIYIHKDKKGYDNFRTKTLIEGIYLSYDSREEYQLINILKLYIPLIVTNCTSRKRPFVIVHMAQTIDGKICTSSGKSKWIGNQENLVHAHRIRALVDGVLVGGNTITSDLPKLNVRHVKGKNPARLLLTNSFGEWDKLPIVENAKTILIRSKKSTTTSNHPVINEVLDYDESDQNDLSNILKKLKIKGINSILVEGGPSTVGSFISAGLVDWLQLHIAPMIFGSGKSCISLPEIEEVKEGYYLKNVFYAQVEDAMMITGELAK